MESSSRTYLWNDYRCAYTLTTDSAGGDDALALVSIHPIGVGLSGVFWGRFTGEWFRRGNRQPVYNPDLLGCGDSDKPPVAYYPEDHARQLKAFIETVVRKPVVLLVQGALFPVALELSENPPEGNPIAGMILSGPPAWRTITDAGNPRKQKALWNLFFSGPLGDLFYRYARRREFLRSFSERQLFADPRDIDDNWLDFLEKGSEDSDTRYAVLSFLAGFWRDDYGEAIGAIPYPTLVLFGERASSIGREGKPESPEERLEQYLKHLPRGRGAIIPGRNVLPYESTDEFVTAVSEFTRSIESATR
jgi:pimeloyl-ACP methyl ester carboxylesterase